MKISEEIQQRIDYFKQNPKAWVNGFPTEVGKSCALYDCKFKDKSVPAVSYETVNFLDNYIFENFNTDEYVLYIKLIDYNERLSRFEHDGLEQNQYLAGDSLFGYFSDVQPSVGFVIDKLKEARDAAIAQGL